MNPWWGRQQNRHLFFLPAVMLIAWLFGFGPGILATIISVVALACFWSGAGAGRVPFELLLFFFVSGAVCMLVRSLQRARERADVARVSREQVLTVVAHDLRAPLATIMVSASSLSRETSDPAVVRNRVKTIDRAVVRMDSLIRDLVDAAGVERGELAMTIKSERVDAVVQEAVDLHAPLAQEAGVALESEVAGHDLTMACDRQRILQVLGNLIGNALKFTPSGGRITVRTEAAEHRRVVLCRRHRLGDRARAPGSHLRSLLERRFARHRARALHLPQHRARARRRHRRAQLAGRGLVVLLLGATLADTRAGTGRRHQPASFAGTVIVPRQAPQDGRVRVIIVVEGSSL